VILTIISYCQKALDNNIYSVLQTSGWQVEIATDGANRSEEFERILRLARGEAVWLKGAFSLEEVDKISAVAKIYTPPRYDGLQPGNADEGRSKTTKYAKKGVWSASQNEMAFGYSDRIMKEMGIV
jgi:hypothetical protein